MHALALVTTVAVVTVNLSMSCLRLTDRMATASMVGLSIRLSAR